MRQATQQLFLLTYRDLPVYISGQGIYKHMIDTSFDLPVFVRLKAWEGRRFT